MTSFSHALSVVVLKPTKAVRNESNGRSVESMSGFTSYFLDKPRKKLICTICRLPMRDPVQIKSCGHRFCDLCLQQFLR